MAQTLQAQITSQVAATYTDARGISTPTVPFNLKIVKAIADGTGSGNAQVLADAQRTLLTATDETLDLKVFDCAFGSAAFTKIKAILIQVVTETTGYTLKVTAGATNGFAALFSDATDELVIQAGGSLLLTAPIDGYVVDATHKTIKISNPAGGSVVYNIVIIGEGAVS